MNINQPSSHAVFKRIGTSFVILARSRVEAAVRRDKWKDFWGRELLPGCEFSPIAFGGFEVGRSNLLITSLMKGLQKNDSESLTYVFCSWKHKGQLADVCLRKRKLTVNWNLTFDQISWRANVAWPLGKQHFLEFPELVRELGFLWLIWSVRKPRK